MQVCTFRRRSTSPQGQKTPLTPQRALASTGAENAAPEIDPEIDESVGPQPTCRGCYLLVTAFHCGWLGLTALADLADFQ